MKAIVHITTLALLLASIPVLAQTGAPPTTGTIPAVEGSISLTEDQQIKIKQFLGKQKPAKLDQKVTIGSTLPEGIELHDVREAGAGLPAIALNYRYAMAESQVFIVNPSTRTVIGVIPE
jgi:hypothetical protein